MIRQIVLELLSLSLIAIVLIALKWAFPLAEEMNKVDSSQQYQQETTQTDFAVKENEKPKKVETIDINLASIEELCQLKGIGEKTAEKIIAYRQKNNYFNSLEELLKIKGIGEKKLQKIRNKISINKRDLLIYLH